MRLSEIKFSPAQHIVLFGDPKTGKTLLVGSLAQKYKLLWFDIEAGVITLTQLPPEFQQNIEVIQLPDTRAYPIAATTMMQVIKGTPTKFCTAHGAINCLVCTRAKSDSWHNVELNALDPSEWVVVLDGITQLGNSVMAHLCRTQPDDYKPGWDEYGPQGLLLDRFFSYVQQAKYNFVCTALCLLAEREDKSQKISPLCGTANYSSNVAKYFDHVIYCEMKGKKHAFGSSTTYSLTALSGSRTSVEIEKLGDTPSLLPFFAKATEMAAALGTNDVNQAAKTLTGLGAKLASLNKVPLTLTVKGDSDKQLPST